MVIAFWVVVLFLNVFGFVGNVFDGSVLLAICGGIGTLCSIVCCNRAIAGRA